MKPGTVSWWNGPNQKTGMRILLFFFLYFIFYFFELNEYNQWRSVIFIIDTTQKWILGITVLC